MEYEKPSWLDNAQSDEAPQHRWKPGQSGNPKGRPPGVPNKRTIIAQEFDKDGAAIARVVIDAALGGDMQAANLVLQRLSPPLRARSEKVTFTLDPDAGFGKQARQVLSAVAAGDIAPDTGQVLLGCISSLAGIVQVDELESRLSALEGRR